MYSQRCAWTNPSGTCIPSVEVKKHARSSDRGKEKIGEEAKRWKTVGSDGWKVGKEKGRLEVDAVESLYTVVWCSLLSPSFLPSFHELVHLPSHLAI